jgi:RHS repeat-associated protein
LPHPSRRSAHQATQSHVYTFDAADTFSAGATVQVSDRATNVTLESFTIVRDVVSPTLTLEAVVQGTDVHVTWNGEDSGSGVDAGTCFLEVREDEGAWQTFSTECGGDATHDGQPGHTYTFRLSASDNVGNADSLEAQAVVPYVTKYYYANGQRVALWQGDVVYYIHTDHLGSTSVLSDESGQQAGERVAYLPYGGVRLGDASTLPTDYGFTGQRNEAGLGLMHYGARFYSPRLGRFVSADSMQHLAQAAAWG